MQFKDLNTSLSTKVIFSYNNNYRIQHCGTDKNLEFFEEKNFNLISKLTYLKPITWSLPQLYCGKIDKSLNVNKKYYHTLHK